MINIAICDDHKEWRDKIEDACKIYFENHPNLKVRTVTFHDPQALLEHIENGGKVRVALLDIVMPGISGIDVAKKIRERGDETEIVFLSTSNEWGMQGYQVKAMDYLLKPFVQSEFDAMMDKVIKLIKAPPAKKIALCGENGRMVFAEVDRIIYVESQRNRRLLHSEDGDFYEMKRTLQALTDELNRLHPDQFVSPIRGYVINMDAIREIAPDSIVMKDGFRIFIKANAYRKFRDFYMEWAFEREAT